MGTMSRGAWMVFALCTCARVDLSQDRNSPENGAIYETAKLNQLRRNMTPKEVIALLGPGYSRRLTLMPTLKKRLGGRDLDVMLIITYETVGSTRTEGPGFARVHNDYWETLALFFADGRLEHQTFYRMAFDRDNNPVALPGSTQDFPAIGAREGWPGANCDLAYYHERILKEPGASGANHAHGIRFPKTRQSRKSKSREECALSIRGSLIRRFRAMAFLKATNPCAKSSTGSARF